MGKTDTAKAETGIWRRSLIAGLVACQIPTLVSAACPGAGCPAISFDMMGGECPGAGCPAFEKTMKEQQSYLELFGSLQSGGETQRPLDGRLLLDIPFPAGAAALPDDQAGFLDGTCDMLIGLGVRHVEVLGLRGGGPDELATRRAATLAEDLTAACAEAACAGASCPTATSRPPGPGDGLPDDVTTAAGHTLIELRVVP